MMVGTLARVGVRPLGILGDNLLMGDFQIIHDPFLSFSGWTIEGGSLPPFLPVRYSTQFYIKPKSGQGFFESRGKNFL